jgi:hypothetical protein
MFIYKILLVATSISLSSYVFSAEKTGAELCKEYKTEVSRAKMGFNMAGSDEVRLKYKEAYKKYKPLAEEQCAKTPYTPKKPMTLED